MAVAKAAPKVEAPVINVVEPVKQEVVFVERPTQRAIPKKVGRDPYLTDIGKEDVVRFMAYHKSLILFNGNKLCIQFDHSTYYTDNPADIQFIRNHRTFGNYIWEGKFPKEVLKKMEDDKVYLTRDDEMFTNPE